MEKFEKIVTLDTEVQAELVGSILSERGIPHLLRSYYDSALDGLFQAQQGWGHVAAPGEFRDEILAVVKDVQSQSRAAEADAGSTPGGPEPAA